MSTTQKAYQMATNLQEELKLRLARLGTPVAVANVTFDSDQTPLIQVGTGSVGAAGGLIKIGPMTGWDLSLNSIGLATPVVAQHEISYVDEASVSGNTPDLVANILFAIARLGCRFQRYQCANGTAPDAAQLIASNKKGAPIDPNFRNGMLDLQ